MSATGDMYNKLLEDGTAKLLSKKSSSTGISNPCFEHQDNKNIESSGLEPFDLDFKMSFMPNRSKIDLQFTEITFCVQNGWKKKSKTILNRISGRFLSGQMNAILGPSGAGKSTLINILSGFRTSNVSGDILINEKPRCLESFRKQSCYIMQEDHLLQYLTVQESMEAAVSLRLGNNLSKSGKLKLIKEISESLKLEDCLNTKVSNLSGGEKKRLSIALELANNPPVMFLDEPTSGLDSQNSYYCVSILKKLAESGRNIICTIHQPSARLFEMFDYVYALAEGQCIYKGTTPNLVPFMLSMGHKCPPYQNPSDFLIELASRENGNIVTKMAQVINNKSNDVDSTFYQESEMTMKQKMENESMVDTTASHSASLWIQFTVLLWRTFRSVIRDPMFFLLQFLSYLVVGLFLGTIYYHIGNDAMKVQSNVGFLFVNFTFVMFASTMMTILTLPLEMNIYIREHFNNLYSISVYFCARTLVDMPFQIIYLILYMTLVYYMTSQPNELWRFLSITSFSLLTSFVAQSVGIMIGAAVSAQKAVYLGTAAIIPTTLLSGFFVTYSALPVYLRWLTYLIYTRYAYHGSMQALYGYNREKLKCSEDLCIFQDPDEILKYFEIDDLGLYFNALILVIYFLVFRVVGYLIFRWKLQSQR